MQNSLLYVAIALVASCGLLVAVKHQDLPWHIVTAPLWLPIAAIGLPIAIMFLLQSIQAFLQKKKNHKLD